MEGRYLFIIVLMITTSFRDSNGYNILGLFPHFGISHYWIFEPILKELAYRGHNVTVYSFFPPKENIKNFNFVNLAGSEQVKSTDIFDFKDSEYFHTGPLEEVMLLKGLSVEMCEQLLKNEIIQELSHASDKYDVVLYEIFIHDCFMPLIGKIDAPRIALCSCMMLPWYYEDFGYIDNPNYNPNIFVNYAVEMSFSERLVNSVYSLTIKLIWNWYVRPNLQAMAEKYIPAPVPKISEVIGETSLVLINTHFTVLGARPMGPNFIEIAGIHLGEAGNLTQDLKNWMDASEHGVIYFSMGSMLRGSTLPDSTRNAIMEVFKGLKENVLWKWEENEIPRKADNVRIEKWLPQRAVLAHPKTKTFITHCGMLSSVEAVDGGVPTLCIPMYGDQRSNQRAMQMKEISVFIEYNDINKEIFRKNLETVLQPKYKQRASEVQRAFRDRPMSPLDTSIYWIEYVVRQNGSEHIKMPTRHLYWFQKFLLDIVFIYILVLLTVFIIIKKILISVKELSSSKVENKKKME